MSDQPNVLLISADHWSGRLLGHAGHPVVMTPTIDRMAANGISFSNAYSACPVCVPARRTLMTGLSARGHGLRSNASVPMPTAPTMAQCFRDGGYQAYGVGKLHVSPQRNRLGFDDVLLCEEGRHSETMCIDDWESFLAERGFPGREYAAGGTQNDYLVTPWHLPDDCHPTNWAAREMCRAIKRRDPEKPAFWYLSFISPHPPLWPLLSYLDQYQGRTVDLPHRGAWMDEFSESLPPALRAKMQGLATTGAPQDVIDLARRAFYAMVTHIDHQIRVVLGTLREEGILGNTVLAFVSDHGDMLGNHGLWAKSVFYEDSAKVPFVVVPPRRMDVGVRGRSDQRLVELRDMMPTLLDLVGLPVPDSVEGASVFSSETRAGLYGECGSAVNATRMFRDQRYKLIYYPAGNRFQLFDLEVDPDEMQDLSQMKEHAEVLGRLQAQLAGELYGEDESWIENGVWRGLPLPEKKPLVDFSYGGQRGMRGL